MVHKNIAEIQFGSAQSRIQIENQIYIKEKDINGPYIDLFFHELSDKNPSAKRFFDILFATVAALFFYVSSPFIALLLKAGGVKNIYTELFVPGIYGKTFQAKIFNIGLSQCSGVEQRSDRAWIQKVLHKTGLFKLPLFKNVFSGDMSMVGPEPFDDFCSNLLINKYTEFYKRYSAKPGIYVPASYYPKRGIDIYELQESSLSKDLKYVSRQNLKNYFKVIFKIF